MKTVQELCVEYGSDKTPEIRHPYAPEYDRLFKDFRDAKTVLEIGVGHPELNKNYIKRDPKKFYPKTGASLRVWRDYFTEAKIYGIDIHPEAVVTGEERIKTITGSSTDRKFVDETMKEIGLCDIIIDDGDHDPLAQYLTAQNFLPHLLPGGLYFIEDVERPDKLTRMFNSIGIKVETLVRTRRQMGRYWAGSVLFLIRK